MSYFRYIESRGQTTEQLYFYTGKREPCRNISASLTKIDSHKYLGSDEEAIANWVAEHGPVSIGNIFTPFSNLPITVVDAFRCERDPGNVSILVGRLQPLLRRLRPPLPGLACHDHRRIWRTQWRNLLATQKQLGPKLRRFGILENEARRKFVWHRKCSFCASN